MATTATSSADVIGLRRRTGILSSENGNTEGGKPPISLNTGASTLRTIRDHSKRHANDLETDDDLADYQSGASSSISDSSLDAIPEVMLGSLKEDKKTKGKETSNLPRPLHRRYSSGKLRSNTRKPSSPLSPDRQRSSSNKSSSSWITYDLSIVVALISPIGNWLTGGDHVKNILLIIFLIFYLHQLIEGICLCELSSFSNTDTFNTCNSAVDFVSNVRTTTYPRA